MPTSRPTFPYLGSSFAQQRTSPTTLARGAHVQERPGASRFSGGSSGRVRNKPLGLGLAAAQEPFGSSGSAPSPADTAQQEELAQLASFAGPWTRGRTAVQELTRPTTQQRERALEQATKSRTGATRLGSAMHEPLFGFRREPKLTGSAAPFPIMGASPFATAPQRTSAFTPLGTGPERQPERAFQFGSAFRPAAGPESAGAFQFGPAKEPESVGLMREQEFHSSKTRAPAQAQPRTLGDWWEQQARTMSQEATSGVAQTPLESFSPRSLGSKPVLDGRQWPRRRRSYR